MENPIKMDDLGIPLFLETSISFWGPASAYFSAAFAVRFSGKFPGGKFQLRDSDGKPTAARTDTKGHGRGEDMGPWSPRPPKQGPVTGW